jgi:heterodisulfide reductase subunit A
MSASPGSGAHEAVLVLGAGPAGLAAAMTLSDLGRRVFLVERQARPGGQARDVQASPHPPEEPSAALEQMARAVLERQDVELVAPATLEAVEGRAGRFTVGIRPWDGPVIEAKVGAIIVATGSAYPAPGMEGPLAGYASFEALLHSTPPGGLPTRVGFIADPAEVGEMLAQHAILDACLLRERAGSEAFVFLRDVPVRGRQGQSLYERALEAGVRFFRTDGRGTTVRVVEGAAVVAGHDQILDRPFELRCDLVVHGGPPETSLGTLEAARVLAMSIEERFLAPANVTFLPARTPREAVFAAGACAGDMGVEEAMRSGRMAALEAHDLLDRTLAGRTPDDVTIDRGRCVACLTCLRLCPYHAVTLGEASHYPSISDADCHDCGLCAAACPQRAITHHGLPDEAVVEQLRAIRTRCSRCGGRDGSRAPGRPADRHHPLRRDREHEPDPRAPARGRGAGGGHGLLRRQLPEQAWQHRRREAGRDVPLDPRSARRRSRACDLRWRGLQHAPPLRPEDLGTRRSLPGRGGGEVNGRTDEPSIGSRSKATSPRVPSRACPPTDRRTRAR